MCDPATILDRCRQAGLTVWRNGESIRLKPAKNCPPDLLQDIRNHKPELLGLLGTTDEAPPQQPPTRQEPTGPADLPGPEILRNWPTGKPASRPVQRGGTEGQWVHTSKQVLAGEFEDSDRGLLESLLIGVRAIAHPACQAAKSRLETMRKARP